MTNFKLSYIFFFSRAVCIHNANFSFNQSKFAKLLWKKKCIFSPPPDAKGNCDGLTWSSQSQRGGACASMPTPASPAGRAGLWGEGLDPADKHRAMGGCWPLSRTAEARQVCQVLQMNQRRYLQDAEKATAIFNYTRSHSNASLPIICVGYG